MASPSRGRARQAVRVGGFADSLNIRASPRVPIAIPAYHFPGSAPGHWEADVRRFLCFRLARATMFLCVGLALVTAPRSGNAQSFPAAIDGSTTGNHFGVDLTFKGANGSAPTGALIQDAVGNLYGTTSTGGYGSGVVFKLDSSHHQTVLHAFTGPDGATPYGALAMDSFGNIYGTTSAGGDAGLGTVFKIDTQGIETVIHSFTGAPDGANPYAGLVIGSSGILYGTTENGGTSGCGTLFKIDTTGVENVLHSFAGGPTDGADPKASLILDLDGNLYGTTLAGGSSGYGTVFELDLRNTETILYDFTGGSGGGNPFGGVTRDANGVLYGTTETGGGSLSRPYGCCKGTVYALIGNHQIVLYSFSGGNDGGMPVSNLVLYNGVLYGTTLLGGPSQKGTVFRVSIGTGGESVLHGFTGKGDGGAPQGGLLMDAKGTLYGTAEGGGQFMKGTVYQQSQ